MVRVNLHGREPRGIVAPEAVDGLVRELAGAARARQFPDGRPLFVSAGPASTVFEGLAPGGPDLVMEPSPGTEVRGRNASGRRGFLLPLSEVGTYYPSGVHTPMGIVVAAGTGVRRMGRVEETRILQVAPSVLAVMGVPAPPAEAPPFPFISGPPITAPAEGVAASQSTDGGVPGSEAESPPSTPPLTGDEEAAILERLRGLGYVD